MTEHRVHERLTAVFRRVFDDDTLVIGPHTTAADVDGWDSLSHVNLIVAVEREFKVRLAQAEIMGLHEAGDLLTLVATKLG